MKHSEIKGIVAESIENGNLSNDEMVQLIELIGMYLNLQTIPNYAKLHSLSYNGVKKNRKIIQIFHVKFVIDNY